MNQSKVGYVDNIEKDSLENNFFRKVLFTGPNMQLVIMALQPGEDIGSEVHEEHDQFIRVEQGAGMSILNGEESNLEDGSAVLIPAGTEHNIVNTSDSEVMKLYTLYSPPEHADGTINETKPE